MSSLVDADTSFSELPGTIKVGGASAWPMSGGLNSISNASTVRTQVPVLPIRVDIPGKPVNTAHVQDKMRTPSPKKVTIKIEPASGKENVTIAPNTK